MRVHTLTTEEQELAEKVQAAERLHNKLDGGKR